MNRRTFMQALAGFLGMFGLGSLVAKEPSTDSKKLLKWCRWFRECDKHTMNTFTDITICDECGEGHAVPIIWANEEEAAKFVLRPISESTIGHTSNPEFEKLKNDPVMDALRDRTVKVEVIRLPLINIHRNDFKFIAPSVCLFYTLTARTLYKEDMNQITEQIINKFYPAHQYGMGKMELTHIANNESTNDSLKVHKYQFTIKVTTPPLEKKK